MASVVTQNQPRANLPQTVRAGDWWEFKLSPIFATIYATALLTGSPVYALWPLLLLSLAALVPGAAYVSVINDLTDLEDDRAGGKRNRLEGKSRAFAAAVLAGCLLPGVVISFSWRGDPLLLSLYLAAWLAFSLYSIPPVRLKRRGAPGLLADAAGAHLFPTLVVVVLVFRWRGAAVEPAWFGAVAVWSLCFGLRGNLWHQLSDRAHDERAGLRTFARRHNIALLRGLGNFAIFPLELAAFAFILWRLGGWWPAAFLLLYALLEAARRWMWRMNLVVVMPRERYSIALLEYYEVFYPAALLLASAARDPLDFVMLGAHLLLFPRRAAQVCKDALKLLRQTAYRLLR